ncbi:c-type cytochrome [Thiohalorhabdus sp.]|uniref:c-type cytochrome n=1 Tax=Thiohalorhabdus sp. TaxID=3094134 RepID=UPI002FC28092
MVARQFTGSFGRVAFGLLVAGLFLLPLHALAQDAAGKTGKALYQEHCATCHGDEGQGGIGLPLNLPDFLRTADRDYLLASIRHGRPGRVMPSFQHLLTEEERQRIAKFVMDWQEGVQVEVPAVGPGDAERGGQLFQQNCAECHGTQGEGGDQPKRSPEEVSPDSKVVAPALNNSGFLASASDAFIKATIARGRGSTRMAAHGKARGLSDRDLDDLVAFIRSWEEGVDPLAKPVIEVRTDTPVDELIPLLKMAINSNNFVFIRQQTLYEGLAGDTPEEPVRVLHFCSFGLLDKALQTDERVGTFLPCQITVYRDGGQTVMSAINPKALSPLFHKPGLELYCTLVSERYLKIMQEASF